MARRRAAFRLISAREWRKVSKRKPKLITWTMPGRPAIHGIMTNKD